MKLTTFLIAVVLIGISLSNASAQTLDLPDYTTEQRWERAALHVTFFNVLLLREGMETGKNAEEVGQSLATIVGPGWSGIKNPAEMARAMHRNWFIWPGAEFEAEEAQDGSVSIKANRPWQDVFGESGILYEVSVQHMDTAFQVFHEIIARQQGMDFHLTKDDEWFMIRISHH